MSRIGGQKQIQDSCKHAAGKPPLTAMPILAILLQAAANISRNKCDQCGPFLSHLLPSEEQFTLSVKNTP
jgi:hypothetical protein